MPAAAPASGSAVSADAFEGLPRDAVVAVAMSGGVDSSVAAARASARVRTIGVTLAMWPRGREVERDRGCCSVDAVEDARAVARTLGIAHYVWNLEDAFAGDVIAHFEREYAAGRTPNPCVRCNERIKYGALLERALAAGATHLATGHYARTGSRGGLRTLHRAADPRRDQAYTLHRLTQPALRRALFPLGGEAGKDAVREEARSLGLRTAAKPDSQDLCFVDGPVATHLERALAGRFRPGPIRDTEGREVGEHRGLPFYTVGQRSRLGLRPLRPDAPAQHVVRLDAVTNTVVVGPREALLATEVTAGGCAWIAGEPPAAGTGCTIQLRAHGDAHPGTVVAAGGSLVLRCDPPVSQVSPGQAVVLYRGDEVLGGGVVERSRR